MRIGIDARFYNESGVGRYLRNLIKNLQILDYKNDYFIFLLPKDFSNFSETKNFQKVLADFAWYGFAEQFKFPKLLNKYNLDLVHFPHFNVPIFYTGKFVVTIHDLIHQRYAMRRSTTLDPLTFKIKQVGYRKVFTQAIKKSEKILVPSKFVAKLLTKEWQVADNKIIVTPEGVDDKILEIAKKMSKEKSEAILTKLKVNLPFIFYVGNAHPHKNVEGLIKAFIKLKEQFKNLNLVLSGYDHFFWKRLKEENQHPAIVYTGFVSDEELVALYKNANCLIIPSFEEGFGLPVLEAMALECPVVASSEGSLPEIGEEAAIYFDPKDTGDMIDKVARVLNSEALKVKLIEQGKKRVKKFSWEKMAKQTLEEYLTCV